KYLERRVTNYNFIYGEIKNNFDSVNACYNSVQKKLSFQSPIKSVGMGSSELGMPKMTVWKVLRKRLCFKPYKICASPLTSRQSVKAHSVRIWGTEQPHAPTEHQRESPKVNVSCAVSCEKVHGQFFFPEATVTGESFLDMLERLLLPQLNTSHDDYILQLERASLLPCPPRSPDLTTCDFFLWGFVKDSVYAPPLPTSIHELRGRIAHALLAITVDMLHRVWDEFDYRVDVCHMTQGAHIERL
ncbi:hypothetical protein B7P43_G05943, partial [Cryptotermes secundus]